MKNILLRHIDGDLANISTRGENEGRFFNGYASVVNHRSTNKIYENGKDFYEIIHPRAFDEVLTTNPDVRLTYNHDIMHLLARTRSKTMTLSVDEYGLRFLASVPNTTDGNDVYEMVQRGDIFECSFAFWVKPEDEVWSVDEEGNNIKTIMKISRLYDCSLVCDGAYSGTIISARSDEQNKTITITISEDEDDNSERTDVETEPKNEGTDSTPTGEDVEVEDKSAETISRLELLTQTLKLKYKN
jgi:HK97 family phage prohead protease